MLFLSVICFFGKANVSAASSSINEDLVIVSENTIYFDEGSFIKSSIYYVEVSSIGIINTYSVNDTYSKTGVRTVT